MSSRNFERSTKSALALLLLGLSACATPPADPIARAEFEQTNDPFEPANREFLDFNLFLERVLLKPVAKTYRTVLPDFARTRVRNFLSNLNEPVVFINDGLQGEFGRAHTTFARFLVNTTFGVGGLWDQATGMGLEKQSGDFGQTLYSWGVPAGPYLVVPLLGPSNPRDAIGTGVDSFADPFKYVAAQNGSRNAGLYRFLAQSVDEVANNMDPLDEIQKNAIDFYAELRSLTRQRRADELRHGEPAPPGETNDLYSDPALSKP